ncbi:glutathione S-transferase family protein [Erythrobacter sp. HA6-11]
MKLIIGNKRSSSWSLRPWLLMEVKSIPFEEELSPFDFSTKPHSQHFNEFSPTKMVPVMLVGGNTIWDSLAIMETLAELSPDRQLWPTESMARAHARAISCEMHSGFRALRYECPMDMTRSPSSLEVSDECKADVERIETIFGECFDTYKGPFLFGEFTIADAMFAPVANRLRAYQLTRDSAAVRFCEAIEALHAWKAWSDAAKSEPWEYDLFAL